MTSNKNFQFVSPTNVRVTIKNGTTFIETPQEDGWNHLKVIDINGNVRERLVKEPINF